MTGLDRRAVLFAIAAVVCVVLVPATPSELEWVGLVTAVWFAILSVASLFDDISRRNHRR